MWEVIGIYGGAEDNMLFRRGSDRIVKSGGKLRREGDVFSLGADAIRSVDNPMRRFAGAIHVYGGDFVNQPRSQLDPDTLREQPYDGAQIRRVLVTRWEARCYDRLVGQLSDTLGVAAPDEELASGGELSIEQALEIALDALEQTG